MDENETFQLFRKNRQCRKQQSFNSQRTMKKGRDSEMFFFQNKYPKRAKAV